MNNSYQIGEKLLHSFDEEFKDVKLSHKDIKLQEGLIHAFFIESTLTDYLEKNWRKISNFIALNFQNNLENEFERWNIYVFFLNAKKVSNELKYKIENDTFSSRKIVVDYETNQNSIVSNHILNNNLRINKGSVNITDDEFQPNEIVWTLLKDKTLKISRTTKEAENSFNSLIKILHDKDHEI
jgi:hypothetical protein